MKRILAALMIVGSTAVMAAPAAADGVSVRIVTGSPRVQGFHSGHRHHYKPHYKRHHRGHFQHRPRFNQRAYRACMHRTYAYRHHAYRLSPRRVHLHCLNVAYRFGGYRRHGW
jgi:Ni/Co efflux regulator RcnB